MAFNQDPNRYKMIQKGKIEKAIQGILDSDWGRGGKPMRLFLASDSQLCQETERLGDMLRAKYQPQLAFAQITGEDLAHYVDDIASILESPTFE